MENNINIMLPRACEQKLLYLRTTLPFYLYFADTGRKFYSPKFRWHDQTGCSFYWIYLKLDMYIKRYERVNPGLNPF